MPNGSGPYGGRRAAARGPSTRSRRRRARRSCGPRRRRCATPFSTSGTRCLGTPSKSNAFGRPRGSSASSAIETFSSKILLAEPAGEIAALLEQAEPAERVEGEVLEQLGERVRLEHRAVGARLERLRAACRAAPSPPPRAPTAAGSMPSVCPGRPARVARLAVRPRRARASSASVMRWYASTPAVDADRELGRAAREEPVAARAADASIAARRSRACSSGAERRRLRVVQPSTSGSVGGGASPGKPSSATDASAASPARAASSRKRSWSSAVRRRDADPAVADDAQRARLRSRSASAGAPRSREAREPRALGRGRHLGLVALARPRARAPRPRASRSRRDADLDVAEARRRRAVRDVRALARLALAAVRQPVQRHSSGPATASSEPQNCGVMPV